MLRVYEVDTLLFAGVSTDEVIEKLAAGDACDRGAAQRVGACPASRSISTCVPVSRAMVKPSRS